MEAKDIEAVLTALRENRQLSVGGGAIYRESAGAGVGLEDADLALINEWTRNPVNRENVYTFPALAIDEQATRNFVRYTAASQRASVSRWVGIPFLYNEDSQWASLFDGSDHSLKASSQMGRIYKSSLVRTPEGYIGTLVHVYTVKGVDEKIDSFIARVDAGLLKEVSLHVMLPEGVRCNICKQMYPCEKHEIAHEYDGVTCTVDTVGAYTPLELSSVACPGSLAAHIMADDDTSSYRVLALREALGGARSLLENNMHKSESCEVADCKETVCVEKRAAEQHSAEKCDAADCKETVCIEAKKTKQPANDDDEDDDEDKEGDDDETKAAKKQKREAKAAAAAEAAKSKTHLFTENCPACGGTSKEAATATSFEAALEPVRADFQERVTAIVTKAEETIAAANARASEAAEKAAAYDAMFAEYVAETVNLASERGVEEASDVDAYREKITKLGFTGVQSVREALKAAKPVSRETAVEKLKTTAAERAKSNLGTHTVSTENGVAEYKPPRLK